MFCERACKRGLPAIRPEKLAYRRGRKDLQAVRYEMELFMKLAVFVICVSVVVLCIGLCDYVEKLIKQDDKDDWGGHWPY